MEHTKVLSFQHLEHTKTLQRGTSSPQGIFSAMSKINLQLYNIYCGSIGLCFVYMTYDTHYQIVNLAA